MSSSVPRAAEEVPEFPELWKKLRALSEEWMWLLTITFGLPVGKSTDKTAVMSALRVQGVFTEARVWPVREVFDKMGGNEIADWYLDLVKYDDSLGGRAADTVARNYGELLDQNLAFVHAYYTAARCIDDYVFNDLKVRLNSREPKINIMGCESVSLALQQLHTLGFFCRENFEPLVNELKKMLGAGVPWVEKMQSLVQQAQMQRRSTEARGKNAKQGVKAQEKGEQEAEEHTQQLQKAESEGKDKDKGKGKGKAAVCSGSAEFVKEEGENEKPEDVRQRHDIADVRASGCTSTPAPSSDSSPVDSQAAQSEPSSLDFDSVNLSTGGEASDASDATRRRAEAAAARRDELFLHRIPEDRISRKGVIGQGQFGTVSCAELDADGDRKSVAVKDFKEINILSDSSLRELRTILCTNHKNIVHVLGLTTRGSLVMENCTHRNLARVVVKSRGETNEEIESNRMDVTRLLLDAARGIAWIHALQPALVHGDVKLSNILVTEENSVLVSRISDFGMSGKPRNLDDPENSSKDFAGSDAHAAPELLSSTGVRLSCEADVYAFGCTMYHAFERRPVWYGVCTNHLQLWENVRSGIRPPFNVTPPKYRGLISRCWSQDPADRPTFADIVKELEVLVQPAFDDIFDDYSSGHSSGTVIHKSPGDSMQYSSGGSTGDSSGGSCSSDGSGQQQRHSPPRSPPDERLPPDPFAAAPAAGGLAGAPPPQRAPPSPP